MVTTTTIKKGYKQTELGVIPEDWEVKNIEDLTPPGKKFGIVDGPFGSNLKTIHYRKSGIPIITSGYVTDGKFFAPEYLYVDIEKFKQERRSAVRGGDIVMAKIGERCGASAILPKDHSESILSGNALKISIDENKFSTELIAQILWRHYTIGNLELLRTTGAQPAISMANLKKYKIPIPATKLEQTAITAVLSDTDALIEHLEELITKKKAIKQGAMQQILIGKKRLPGFSGKWKVKKLGDVSKVESGINKSLSFIGKGGAVYITVLELYEGSQILTEKAGRIEVSNDEIRQYSLQSGDIVFGKSSVKREGIGYPNIFVGYKEPVVFSGFTFRARAYRELADPFFIIHILRMFSVRNWLINNSQASALTNINQTIANNIPLFIPLDTKEQSAISKVLFDMDIEIEMLEQKRDKYTMIKQGMMQQLLTGKIRIYANN